jgi:uncharacterized protein (DUF736 family)
MEESCGAIWKRKSAKGNEFLSIKIGDKEYIAFTNDKGDNPKRPDFKVYPSTPRDDGFSDNIR